MFSPHFLELLYLPSSVACFGCPFSSLQQHLFKWTKDRRGRVAEGLGEQVLGGLSVPAK